MDDRPPGIRRVCVAAAWDRAAGGNATASDQRRLVREALISACASAGLQRGLPCQQRHGRAEVLLLPTGIDEPRVLAQLTRSVGAELRRINAAGGGRRLRVALAFHEGIVALEPSGFSGVAIGRACRLAVAPETRSAMASHPAADLIVLLTDRIFDDLREQPDSAFGTARFERVDIEDPAVGRRTAWLCAPALPQPA